MASCSCSIKGAFLNNCNHQLLLWELAPRSSWEEDEMLSACSCACSLHDHKLLANGAHFTGETVMFSAHLLAWGSLVGNVAPFPTAWPCSLHCPRSPSAPSGYCHCVITLFLLMSTFCFFLKLYSTKNLSRQNSFFFLLNYLYTRYAFPQGLERLSFP